MSDILGTAVSVAVFSFVTSVTPGPNNTYLLTSGINFGAKKSLTYVNGIIAGLIMMFAAMYFGVGALFRAYPAIQEVMKYVGFAYIVYMAYSIIQSSFTHKHEKVERIGFVKATFFQLLNPKAWIVIMSVVAAYIPASSNPFQVSLLLAVFLIATYPGAVIWAIFGELMAGLLSKPVPRRIFNVSAAVLLVVSMIPVVFFD